jgi:uncharacterized membrane protein YeaQ/YmgE (transglycosylase-associated protein family)
MGILWSVIIGALAGGLANSIMKRGQKGFLRNMILGIIGGVVGAWVFGLLGVQTNPNIIGKLVTSLAGALIVLWIAEKLD